MMNPGERTFRGDDGREWTATLEAPELRLDAPPDLQNTGAMLPGEAVRIVFRSGDEVLSEEYTGLSAVEDLSDDDLRDWLAAAARGKGL
ncbi:MAG TPA: hypothetical protein VHG28_07895 [Longimicrobiaceae bacterium]|nr:hypothetical protein [Longimicrobiaceae bacterium]